MLEFLGTLTSFVLGVLVLVYDLCALVASSGYVLLLTLHVEAPRLEGLLVGVTLAWLMSRRNKHPLLRVLSAPLKLVLDILDLAWDQVVEIVGDSWVVASGWVLGGLGWVQAKVAGLWQRGLGVLTGLRDKLKKSE